MTNYKLKGINEDQDYCEICGKTNLKKVMWLAELDEDNNELGHVFAAGTTCGASKLGISQGSKTRDENAVTTLAYELVKEEIARILTQECVNFQMKGTAIPRGYGRQIVTGELTLVEVVKIRNETWPILEYNAGRLSVEEALTLI